MARHLISRQMGIATAIFALYGLWIVGARLPSGLAPATWLGASIWAVALFAGGGAVVGAGVSMLAVLAGQAVSARRAASVAATIQTALCVPLFGGLLLNEIVYATTADVLGVDSIALIWRNPAATLEAAWEMGAKYLLSVAAAMLVAIPVVYRLSVRSFTRSKPVIPEYVAGSLIAGLIVLAGLLTWQFLSEPSEAFTVVLRSAPPLRAMNLTRKFVRVELTGPVPEHFGPPIISDETYQATMGSPRSPAPNVVFILLESVPAKALHCYGYPRADITPNIDALAADGTLFEHCLVASSFSSYSVVSIMTSLYMLRGQRYDGHADSGFPFMSFPRALKLAGYQLALFSSGNESFDNINRFARPEDFDLYFSHDTTPDIPKPDCMRMDDRYAVAAFEKWITQRTDPRPFYCGFYLQSTHFNYEVPEPWASHYQPTPPLYSNGDAIIRISPDVLPLLRNQYDNAMRYGDHGVGRIRVALERVGLFDKTIIFILGDHGEAFMEHGLARHGVDVWEEMIHVPFIVHVGSEIRQPLSRPLPSRFADTVSGIDLGPTIVGLVGIQPHPSWQGMDVLAPGYTSLDRPIFSMLQLTRWQELVVFKKLKYIYDLTDVKEQLYDLNNDPGEHKDMIDCRPELADALQTMLGAWHARQLHYYSATNRPLTHYIGRYKAPAEFLRYIHRLCSRTDPQNGCVDIKTHGPTKGVRSVKQTIIHQHVLGVLRVWVDLCRSTD